ncbi:MAG: hypothetical protein IPF79_08915 [Ignavibacteria bacterium]|nr:hypothetical protein [Ignavibacteria bacterium]
MVHVSSRSFRLTVFAILLIGTLQAFKCFAQEAPIGAGGDLRSSIGSMSVTVGALVAAEYVSDDNVVVAGLQAVKPDDSVSSVLFEGTAKLLSILVTPNPADDYVEVRLSGADIEPTLLNLTDVAGNRTSLVFNGNVADVSRLSPGLYWVVAPKALVLIAVPLIIAR